MAKKAATKTKKPVGRPKKPTTPTFDADAAAETIHRMMDKIEGRPKNMRDMQPSDFPAILGISRSKTDQQFLREFVQGLSDEVKQLVIQEVQEKAQRQQALKGPEYESSIKWLTPSEKIKDNSQKFSEKLFTMGNFISKAHSAPVLGQTHLPEIPQQIQELYQSTERLCIKVAELEQALESVLKGAKDIVKAQPKEAGSPLGRDLSQLDARLSDLSETVETITLRLAI